MQNSRMHTGTPALGYPLSLVHQRPATAATTGNELCRDPLLGVALGPNHPARGSVLEGDIDAEVHFTDDVAGTIPVEAQSVDEGHGELGQLIPGVDEPRLVEIIPPIPRG